jgi:hypothetical protein
MTESTPTQEPTTPHDASWFAVEWVRGSPSLAVRTMPVIAVVQELLDVLRDPQVSLPEAHRSLRRAVRLLGVFAAEPIGKPQRRWDDGRFEQAREWTPTPQHIAEAVASRRFAAEWLRGAGQDVIRSEPVIAVVQALLNALLAAHTPSRTAHDGLRRAVRLLSVFVIDDEHTGHPVLDG